MEDSICQEQKQVPKRQQQRIKKNTVKIFIARLVEKADKMVTRADLPTTMSWRLEQELSVEKRAAEDQQKTSVLK